MNKIFVWLKNQGIKLSVVVVFYLFIYLNSNFKTINLILTLIILNIIMDYFVNIRIKAKKIVLEKQYISSNKNFNSEYYDLYWDFNNVRFKLLLTIELIILPLAGRENFTTPSKCIILFIMGVICWFIVCAIGHNNQVFFELINRKGEDYSTYSTKDLEILDKLK